MINDRKSGASKSFSEESDLLSILIGTEIYKDHDELIIDEIITFFFAGMKTIQTTSANLIYYLAKDK